MTIIGQDVLTSAGKRNKPLRTWLANWTVVAREAQWASLEDVRKDYPSADGVTLKSQTVVTVFNVRGNNYRLLTWIDYRAGVIEALEVTTHAEYDKNFWKVRY
jgi:mRNA interferase HigB